MKKLVSVLLIALLLMTILPSGVFAANVVLSPQSLMVDGKVVECEKYNIDGSNYFKVRDIAYILNGTGSQFSVEWDENLRIIRIVTGQTYVPDGSELDLSGGDKSSSAVPGVQPLLINGVERSDLNAYNIGGNNYLKLRDMGEALGFAVDYDKATNTAFITSNSISNDESAWDLLESLGKVKAENGVDYAYLTLPADFVGEDITQAQIDAKAGENYTSGTLNQDGSVTYKMTKSQHKAMLDNLVVSIDEALQGMVDDPDFSVGSISHNSDYSSFDVYLETEELSFMDSFMVIAFYMYGGMYSLFAGIESDNISVNYYSASGNLIQTANSKDMGG